MRAKDGVIYTLRQDPPTVGYYDWGGTRVYVTRKPNRFQPWMIRLFFGWKWVDA